MPLMLNELGARIAGWMEAGAWSEARAAETAGEARGLPDWKIDELARRVCEERLGTDFERGIAACAYEFGLTQNDIRAVLRVTLRDRLIAGEGREPPKPKDGTPRLTETPPERGGWRQALGVDDATDGAARTSV